MTPGQGRALKGVDSTPRGKRVVEAVQRYSNSELCIMSRLERAVRESSAARATNQ